MNLEVRGATTVCYCVTTKTFSSTHTDFSIESTLSL